MEELASVDLYWLPLGAGGPWLVRASGRVYERLTSRHEHRSPRALYHSALLVRLGSSTWTVEMAPVWSHPVPRGVVVAEGAVGHRALGRSRMFRYGVRCWRDGTIPDIAEAVDSPVAVPTDVIRVQRLLAAVREVPTPVWGRDELRTGDMWNSNSVIAWVLASSGHRPELLSAPNGGRAPGWDAGVRLVSRSTAAIRADT